MDKIKAEYEELTQKIKQSLPIKALPSAENHEILMINILNGI